VGQVVVELLNYVCVLQRVAVYCSVLQCLADKCIHILCVFRETVDPAVVEKTKHFYMFLCVAVCCSLFECIAVSRRYKYTHSIFWCKTVDPAVVEMANHFCMLQRVAACCSVLQRVAACCSVLQCVAVCCSVLRVLQCAALCCNVWPIYTYFSYTLEWNCWIISGLSHMLTYHLSAHLIYIVIYIYHIHKSIYTHTYFSCRTYNLFFFLVRIGESCLILKYVHTLFDSHLMHVM